MKIRTLEKIIQPRRVLAVSDRMIYEISLV